MNPSPQMKAYVFGLYATIDYLNSNYIEKRKRNVAQPTASMLCKNFKDINEKRGRLTAQYLEQVNIPLKK